ncbi:MAG TPA: TerC/Alx family metal homeostasis membrane protein [Gaiellales bacterium]|nr:TerC/Alx family metal homeostasis membrane protein [Gaiellales bacterium]
MVLATTLHAGPEIWAALFAALAAMIVVDLAMLRPGRAIGVREAALWSVAWFAVGLGFGAVLWVWAGSGPAAAYLGGYLVERSLSIDNVFVFALIMAAFGVSDRHQARVLLWGVLGALVLRAVLIAAGVELLDRVAWTAYVMGALLVVTGVRMVRHRPEQADPTANPVARAVGRILPVDADDDSGRVIRWRGGRLVATPLLPVLVAVATTDLVFAVDSVPAILAITQEPLLLVAANAFAMLGLRSLYFSVAGLVDRFVYLAPGLAVVLVFIGLKMVWAEAVGHVPLSVSLPVIGLIIAGAVAASFVATRGRGAAAADAG